MERHIFPTARIHPGARDKVASTHRDFVDEAIAAVAAHDVVVLGMQQNLHPKKARAFLDAKGIPYHYIEHGSYLGGWRRRNALKLWTGWPTFPMIFVKGIFIGGRAELERLSASGDLTAMLAAPRPV